MKLSDLLKLPMMEDKAVGGVLDTTCLNDVDVTYVCNSLGIDNSLSLEEKRDIILPIIKRADTLSPDFDPETYKLLCAIANNYDPSVYAVEDEEEEFYNIR